MPANKRKQGKKKLAARGGRNESIETGSRLIGRPIALKLWNQSYTFVQVDPQTRQCVSDPLADSVYNFSFTLDQIPYFRRQAELFEYYRLRTVMVVYKPLISEVIATHSSVANSTFVAPDIAYGVNQYSNIYTSFSDFIQRGDAAVKTCMERWVCSFEPTPLLRAFDNLAVDGFVNQGPQWITTSRPDVPHYGFGLAIEPNSIIPPTPSFGGRLAFYFKVDFKHPRLAPGGLAGTGVSDTPPKVAEPVHEEEKL